MEAADRASGVLCGTPMSNNGLPAIIENLFKPHRYSSLGSTIEH